jgi:ribonuclease P protein component
VLPAAARLRRRQDFAHVVRRGRRASRGPLVVHALPSSDGQPHIGFVVGKAVGNAVTRNLVRRRLREVLRVRLAVVDGSSVVVRALPGAALASFDELGTAVDAALAKVVA